jgi:hypothetical protein
MASRFEWAHVSDVSPDLVEPVDLAEVADDGNPNGDFGLSFSTGSNGCMIFGTLDGIDELADKIKQMVTEARGS